ncbi:hypothetical protein A9Q78_08665 [Methylophaga sp. 41_12_T18]|nr:hypothetical protein A9Q78_08665 [Methylophaga sp. 41_12_T18]
MRNIVWVPLLLLMFLLSACQEQTVEIPEPPVRAVKLFTISEANTSSERLFSGTTVATSSASLSFPVSGKITDIYVNAGEEVSKGQLLAKLDASSFNRLKNMAVTQNQQAKVLYEDKLGDYSRKKPLGEKGVITLRDLEESKAAMLSAKEQLNLARTNVHVAQDNIDDTFLYAPYDGIISERSSEPFVEITASQQILLLENKGAIEVEIAVPENIIAKIKLGQAAKVIVKAAHETLAATISEISSSADVGNVFAVKVTIDDAQATLYSGLSAEVVITLEQNKDIAGVLIPLSCVIAGNDQHDYVYIFNPDNNTVIKTAISNVSNVIGNSIVVEGIKPGDQVVSAGVTFLADGLLVKPYQSAN